MLCIENDYDKRIEIKQSTLDKASDAALRAIYNELPEEFRCMEVMQKVVSDCTFILKTKKIVL